MTDLLDKAARLACWRGPVELSPLKGGLTNISFVATCCGEKFVVRCGEDIPVHHVFRDRERAAAMAAFEAGLSPEIIHVEPGIMVLRSSRAAPSVRPTSPPISAASCRC